MEFANSILEGIWKDRYQKNGESYNDNLKRVAKYIANGNNKEEEMFYQVMKDRKFFPAGRTMSNSGIGRDLTLNNCFIAGTKVLTKRGYINIEDVRIGDYVVTEDDSFQKVVNTLVRDYEGDIFKISSLNILDDIYCTPNHMFLTNFGWKRADRLIIDSTRCNPVDKLKVPNPKIEKVYETIDISEFFNGDEKNRIRFLENDKLCIETFTGVNRFNDKVVWKKDSNEVNRYINFSPEFRYFIGRWIGDGSITKRKEDKNHSILQIVFNSKTEIEHANVCEQIGNDIFGFACNKRETEQNTIVLRWENKILGEFFFKEFGEKCDGKFLKEKYNGDIEIAKGIIDSDGYLDSHGGGRIVLKNKGLIEWLRNTLYLNGVNTNKINKVKNLEDTYSLSYPPNLGNRRLNKELLKTFYDKRENKITDNHNVLDYIYIKNIDILENQKCKVYNLSVENINSYIANGVVVHNCFVAPQIKDDLTDIFNKVSLGAKTHQRGGGIGYDFSQLRPNGTPTSNDAIASGAVSFMDVFNSQTATILQGGRRGANMGVMSVYNMDIEEFINAKSYEEGKLNHFNVSVMVDDDFISAVRNNEKVYLHYPVYDEEGKLLKDESKWKLKKEIDANYIWDLIMRKAYDNGEPGIFFYDNLNRDNNLWYIENIVCTNPCAEYLAGTIYGDNPLNGEKLNPSEYGGACNLGSIFLHNFVVNPFTNHAYIDYQELENTIYIAVRFLDNVIDINNFPDQIYKNYQEAFRTIGLGVTGLADMLAMLNFEYNSQMAYDFVDKLMESIAYYAFSASVELAKVKGSFPFLDAEKYVSSGYFKKHIEDKNNDFDWDELVEDIKKYGIRNAKIMSVAPTGTLSLTFGNNCSSGIEPIFSLEYDRKVKIGGQSDDNVQIVKMMDYAYYLWKNTTKDNIVKEDIFVTAMNMSVQDHVDMLSRIVYHVDMSVSKTINVPTDYSFEDTKNIYMQCYDNGVKGCTIFRPNEIRQGILITPEAKKDDSTTTDSNIEKEYTKVSELPRGYIESVPEWLNYRKYKLKTGCGNLYLFVGIDENDGKIYDCFTNTDGVGGCVINTQANSRLLSAALRGGVPIEYLVTQLDKAGTCPSFQYKRGKGEKLSKGKSCSSAIANVINDIIKEFKENEEDNDDDIYAHKVEIAVLPKKKNEPKNEPKIESNTSDKCPECGEPLRAEGGCVLCASCGWSKCD